MKKSKSVIDHLEDLKEVVDVKLRDEKSKETSPIGVYHLLYRGWRNFYEGKEIDGIINSNNLMSVKAMENFKDIIEKALEISGRKYKETVKDIEEGVDEEENFFFIISLLTNMTVFYTIIEIQKILFDSDKTQEEREDFSRGMLKGEIGNEVMYELIWPAFNYFFSETCKNSREVKKDFYLKVLEGIGSKTCSREGMKNFFSGLLGCKPY